MQQMPTTEPAPAASDGTAVVAARGLTKRFGDLAAVAGLDLDVPAGSIFGFVGPSGSGKTTAVRLLTGVMRPDAGEIRVFGRAPAQFTPEDRVRIGYLPQLSVLFPSLSLLENLRFVASLYGLPLRRSAQLRDALDLVELWEHRHKRLRDASGGMQRRLALAATLVHDPELVFLDEPTAGIDPVLRRKLWERFRELRDAGRTLFVTTQYVGEAAYCDLVGVVDEERLIAVDTPDGLRRRSFGGELLELDAHEPFSDDVRADLRALEGVRRVRPAGEDERRLWVVVDDASTAIPRVTDLLDRHRVPVESVRQETPDFEDVFVRLIEEGEL